MKVPKEIADKVRVYEEASKTAREAFEAVVKWLNENTGSDAVSIDELFITNEPSGHLQEGDEYCDQHTGYCEDYYYGNYYHPIEGSAEYLGYHFDG